MKKILIIALAFLISFSTFACIVLSTPSNILYLLNWGEYIDKDLVKKFETEYHCQIVEEDVTSSESMYQKITSGTTSYDVAIPGDYTVHQLYKEGYLKELDVLNTEYENLSSYQSIFQDDLVTLINQDMVEGGKTFRSYFMPYFFGSYSLLYSKKKDFMEKTIQKNGFASLYNRSLFQEDVKIGMYSNARWIVASYLLSKGLDPNLTSLDGKEENDLSEDLKKEIIAKLKEVKFNEFGDDSLKRNIANGSLDLCYTQSGDFFDALFLSLSQSKNDISFDIYVPKITSAFFDSMVIPTTCQNETLANQFINFMLDKDVAYQNARSIGYSPCLKGVVSKFKSEADKNVYYYQDENHSLSLKEFLSLYPMYLDPLKGCEKAYLLKPKSREYLTTCETIFNNLA